MLINIRVSEVERANNNGLVLGLISGVTIYYPIYTGLPSGYNAGNTTISRGDMDIFESRENKDSRSTSNNSAEFSSSTK
jgi:hypothetical protein